MGKLRHKEADSREARALPQGSLVPLLQVSVVSIQAFTYFPWHLGQEGESGEGDH